MRYAEGEQCPTCGSTDSGVINIRYRPSLKRVVRRRQCKACGEQWNTVEVRIKERHDDQSNRNNKLLHNRSGVHADSGRVH